MSNWGAWTGRYETLRDQVTDAALDHFCATIDSERGHHTPQAFHWCLCLPRIPTRELGIDGHSPKGGFLPPIPLPRRMWAASDVEFVAPIPLAAAIERRSTVASVREKSGKTGQLVFVEVEHITRADNVEVVRELQTIVYREATTYMAPLPAIGAPDLSNWEWSRTVTPDTTMLFRFSAITFNSHRIHYDLPYALNQEYYPGLVVHGPLMAALLLDLAARRFGPNALSRFSYKSLSPAFAGQPLHLVGRGAAQIELCAIGADGRMVVSATATLRGNDHKSAPPVS